MCSASWPVNLLRDLHKPHVTITRPHALSLQSFITVTPLHTNCSSFYLPSFLRSCIVPIPKGKHGTASDSSNFCGISLSSTYGKLFENIVLFRYGDRLSSPELQFGFKPKSSTNLCSMELKELITYYYHIMYITNLRFLYLCTCF